jgi:hypothetical protein
MHTGSTPVYKPWSGGLPLEEQKFKRFGGSAQDHLQSIDFSPLKQRFFNLRHSPLA